MDILHCIAILQILTIFCMAVCLDRIYHLNKKMEAARALLRGCMCMLYNQEEEREANNEPGT